MNRYDDIIHLPHHVSAVHPQMSLHDRAAQFSPFAALTGHAEAVEETARLTWEEAILDDNAIAELNRKLAFLKQHLQESGPVRITWFREDDRKSGGTYLTSQSRIKKIDETRQALFLEDGTIISMRHIRYIDLYPEIR